MSPTIPQALQGLARQIASIQLDLGIIRRDGSPRRFIPACRLDGENAEPNPVENGNGIAAARMAIAHLSRALDRLDKEPEPATLLSTEDIATLDAAAEWLRADEGDHLADKLAGIKTRVAANIQHSECYRLVIEWWNKGRPNVPGRNRLCNYCRDETTRLAGEPKVEPEADEPAKTETCPERRVEVDRLAHVYGCSVSWLTEHGLSGIGEDVAANRKALVDYGSALVLTPEDANALQTTADYLRAKPKAWKRDELAHTAAILDAIRTRAVLVDEPSAALRAENLDLRKQLTAEQDANERLQGSQRSVADENEKLRRELADVRRDRRVLLDREGQLRRELAEALAQNAQPPAENVQGEPVDLKKLLDTLQVANLAFCSLGHSCAIKPEPSGECFDRHKDALYAAREAIVKAWGARPAFDLVQFIADQQNWQQQTFGSQRLAGVIDHLRKETTEAEENPGDASEWADVLLLGFGGACEAGHEPAAIVAALIAKQQINFGRKWPEPTSQDVAVEHIVEKTCATCDSLITREKYGPICDLCRYCGVNHEHWTQADDPDPADIQDAPENGGTAEAGARCFRMSSEIRVFPNGEESGWWCDPRERIKGVDRSMGSLSSTVEDPDWVEISVPWMFSDLADWPWCVERMEELLGEEPAIVVEPPPERTPLHPDCHAVGLHIEELPDGTWLATSRYDLTQEQRAGHEATAQAIREHASGNPPKPKRPKKRRREFPREARPQVILAEVHVGLTVANTPKGDARQPKPAEPGTQYFAWSYGDLSVCPAGGIDEVFFPAHEDKWWAGEDDRAFCVAAAREIDLAGAESVLDGKPKSLAELRRIAGVSLPETLQSSTGEDDPVPDDPEKPARLAVLKKKLDAVKVKAAEPERKAGDVWCNRTGEPARPDQGACRARLGFPTPAGQKAKKGSIVPMIRKCKDCGEIRVEPDASTCGGCAHLALDSAEGPCDGCAHLALDSAEGPCDGCWPPRETGGPNYEPERSCETCKAFRPCKSFQVCEDLDCWEPEDSDAGAEETVESEPPELPAISEEIRTLVRKATWPHLSRDGDVLALLAAIAELEARPSRDTLMTMLYRQARQCQTPDGAGLLLAIKGHMGGYQVYDGCDELWQAADVIAKRPSRKAKCGECRLQKDGCREVGIFAHYHDTHTACVLIETKPGESEVNDV